MDHFPVGSTVTVVQSGLSPAPATIVSTERAAEVWFSCAIRMLPGWRAALENAAGKTQVEVLSYTQYTPTSFVIRSKPL